MGTINWGRVVLGGLLCWVVFNVLWVAAWFLFVQREVIPVFQELNRPFQETPEWGVFFLALGLVLSIFTIWFYAAIRPRYGPGPRTAAIVGFAVWLSVSLMPTLAWGWQLQFPARMVALDAVAALVAIVVATLAGAWLYKE
jgi:hypothetical protein